MIVRDDPPQAPDDAKQPLTGGLLSAIDLDGRTVYAIAKAADIQRHSLRRFIDGTASINIDTADRLAVALGIKIRFNQDTCVFGVMESFGKPRNTFSEALRSALAICGTATKNRLIPLKKITSYKLSKKTGVDKTIISQFISRKRSLSLDSADLLAYSLGLRVIRSRREEQPQIPASRVEPRAVKVKGTARERAAARKAITPARAAARKLATASKLAKSLGFTLTSVGANEQPEHPGQVVEPTRRCPVELRGEGLPILIREGKQWVEVPKMTGVAYKVLELLTERYRQGGGCTPGELRTLTGAERAMPLFGQALKREGFEPLRKIIPAWNAGRNKVVKIIDAEIRV